jgi:hypothetical protein
MDLKVKANTPVELHSQDPATKSAYQGHYTDPKKVWATDTRGRFHSVTEDMDVNGSRIFLVDYGNGSKVVQWLDPRILL